jgi:hypothetical protein
VANPAGPPGRWPNVRGIETDVSAKPTLSSGARVDSPVVVRVAGLPLTSLDRLRFDESFGLVTDIIRLRDRLGAEGSALSDALYPVIGELTDTAGKPGLVGLRRALHRVRSPGSREWNETTRAALPAHLVSSVTTWIGDLERHERMRGALADVLTAETVKKQGILRDEGGHPGFRRALSQASSALFAELGKWLADEDHKPRQQALVRLAKYMARAAMKTSPYSTFTVTGAGTWTEDGPAAAFSRAQVAGVLELDGFLLQRISRLLCDDPRLSPFLPVRANPGITVAGDRISFTGSPPREPIVTIPASPAVQACLRILADGVSVPFAELRDQLAGDSDKTAVDRFIGALLDAGMLERQLPFHDQSMDPLGELAEWVTAHGGEDFADVVSQLGRVREQLRMVVPVEDVDRQVTRQGEFERAVIDLASKVGLPLESGAGQGNYIFRENAVFTSPMVRCALPRWRPALDDLDLFRRWLAPFDLALPLRVALGVFVGERFGQNARVPLLAVHRAIQEVVAAGVSPGQSDAEQEIARFLDTSPLGQMAGHFDSPMARLRHLEQIRADARSALLDAEHAGGEIQVRPEDLDRLTADWPQWITPPRSLACYVQTFQDHGETHLVLNAAHTGHGRGRSRSLNLMLEANATVPLIDVQHTAPDTPADAELGGLAISALNRRTASLPYEIDYPLATSSRAPDERIPLGELVVVHDSGPQLARLFSPRLGREVRSLHVGMMSDFLLPPVARLLVQAFGATHYVHPSIPLLSTHADSKVSDQMVHHPRVVVGRVVVQRARWLVPIAEVPVRDKGESADAHLLKVHSWLHERSIPTQCFVRVWAGDLTGAGEDTEGWEKWVFDKSRKPVYVDFANWLLLMAFDRMVRDPAPVVVFEEALPGRADALSPDAGDPRVTEFVVEISGQEQRDA